MAYGQHATESAFPHADSPLPVSFPLPVHRARHSLLNAEQLNLYFAWLSPAEDEWWYARMRESVQKLKQIAIEEGIYRDSFTTYPNYAIAGTTADELYGAGNAARLRSIRDRIDPDRVMDLAGGFSI